MYLIAVYGVYLDSPPEREGVFKLLNDFQSGGFGGMTDLERKELQAEFSRLEAEIEDLEMARDSPQRREQINQKTARLQVISVKLTA